jgi:O-antigen/teichoic acid export membrane protein
MSIKRQTLWNMAPMMVTAVTGFISMPLYLRFLGPENYAIWGYVLAFGGMFGFADLGLGVAVGRYVSMALGQGDQAAVRSYWGTGNLIILPTLFLMAGCLVGLGCWLAPKWYPVGAHLVLFRYCIVAGSLELLFSYYSQYWLILSQANLDFRFVGSLRAIMALVRVVPAVLLVYLTRSPLLMVFWFAVAALIELILFVWHGNKIYQLGWEFSSASMARGREMFGYLSKNLAVMLTGSFFNNIDRNVLGRYASAGDYSYYSMAGNPATKLQSVSNSVMGPVFYNSSRLASEDRHSAAAAVYNETFRFVFSWYLLAAVWVATWHPVFIHFWLEHTMGAKDGAAAAVVVGPLLVALVIAACFGAIFNISTAQLAALNRMGATLAFSAAAGMFAIFGVYEGWHLGGVQGAAWGFVLSRFPYVLQDIYTARVIGARGWLDWKVLGSTAAQGLVAAVFALSYLVFEPTSPWLLIPGLIHGGVVAAWLLRQPLSRWIARWGFNPLSSSAIKL